ncbi:MAG: DNA-binding protein WhiA [Saccharofermentanales bacterium]|jgi:DNA-binding transcriptional regulator WhiA|nr:DNA-binding protein WhiA [Bacillota bacterium]
MSLSFSKRLRGSLLAQSRKELSRREARDILGLVLTVAGRSGAGLITFISEQAEYVDYLVSAAQSARLPVHERKAFVKEDALLFSWEDFDDEFRSGLAAADFVTGSGLSRSEFLSHSFLACGSMADPNSQFALEWQLAGEKAAAELRSKLKNWGLIAGSTVRRGVPILYIKNAEQISDFLIMTGATELLLEYVDIRVRREIAAGVNRLMNCDEANTNRQVETSSRQLEAIRYIAATAGLGSLPDNLRLAAEKRLEAPELSIRELGEQMVPPIGKSGMNHRLRRLEEIAEELKSERSLSGQ